MTSSNIFLLRALGCETLFNSLVDARQSLRARVIACCQGPYAMNMRVQSDLSAFAVPIAGRALKKSRV
jgi:hypothetical protein